MQSNDPQPFIFQRGEVPQIPFESDQLYQNATPYIFERLSLSDLIYKPDVKQTIDALKSAGLKPFQFMSKDVDLEEIDAYDAVVSAIPYDFERHSKQISNTSSKILRLGNSPEQAYEYILNNRRIFGEWFSDSDLDNCLSNLISRSEKELLKYCVFNPKKYFTPIAVTYLENQAKANFNRSLITNAIASNPIATAANLQSITELSKPTVLKHLKSIESKPISKKQQTKLKISDWKKDNPGGLQKVCAADLKMSLRTIKTYWK